MAYATQPHVISMGAPVRSAMPTVKMSSPVVHLPATTSVARPPYAAPTLVAPSIYSMSSTMASARTQPASYISAAPIHAAPYVVSSYNPMQPAVAATMTATKKATQATPHLDAAMHDENAFIQFVINATSGKHTAEYKELYHFLLDVFLEADTDFDGLVGYDRFDYMIERAAMLPRKFGLAPSEAESYPSADARRAARDAEFKAIDTSGDGLIAFDEWLAWCVKHISSKAAQLKSGRVAGCNWNVDKDHFVSWIVAACGSKQSREYKELYHFLQECFTAADGDLDGKVNHAEFDTMIEVAAEAPRRFGFAPSAAQTYASDADRIAAREKEFTDMDIHNHGYISFDDWLKWSYEHICRKVATLQ